MKTIKISDSSTA